MSHPNGDSQEPVYTPGSVPVPAQPSAPQVETYIETPAVPSLAPAFTPPAEVPTAPVPVAPAAPVYPDTAAYPVAGPAVPVPAAPVSAPGYAPVSGPGYAPVSAAPYGYAPVAEAPKKKGRAGIIVLSITTALFGLAAAGITALYIVDGNAADKKDTQQAAALAAEEAKVKELEAKYATSKSEVAKLTQDVAGAKSKTDEVTKEREALANCFRASDTYAAAKNTENARNLIVACTEAEKYY